MLMITVNAYDPGSRKYSLVCDTRLAAKIEEVSGLFREQGRFGMNYEYKVLDRHNGKKLASFYSDRLDIADTLKPNYRHFTG